MKKLELTKREWRSKFAIKEGELQAVQVRNNELHSQISSLKSDTISGSSSQIRSLTERAVAAEKRAQTASNQLASLEKDWQSTRRGTVRLRTNGKRVSKSTRIGCGSQGRRLRRKSKVERKELCSWKHRSGVYLPYTFRQARS